MASNETTDGREIVAINRIPAGHTIYPTGQGDAISSNGYAAGTELIFDASNKVKRFQMLGHWYGIGGRIVWEGADMSDHINAVLKAPATAHAVNEAGNVTKIPLGGGAHLFVPVPENGGDWNLDLDAKFTGTSVLKCTPVPVVGNNGFFDYNSDTNVLTPNYTQTGSHNLYDFEASMFRFVHKCWGRKQDGAESSLEIPDVVGKLLLNTWVVEFTLVTAKESGIKVGVIMISAVKKNI